jgi:hypothetical protein
MVAGRAGDYDQLMRVPWLVASSILSVAAGCGVTDFDVDESIPQQTVMGSPLPGPLATLFPIPVSLNINSQIEAMHTGPIKSVTLKSLELDIQSPASADWSFVTEIDVQVSSTKSGSTLPTVKVAHVTSPGAVKTILFTIEPGVNLKPYIDEGSSVDGQSSGNAPSQDVTFAGSAAFTVHPL